MTIMFQFRLLMKDSTQHFPVWCFIVAHQKKYQPQLNGQGSTRSHLQSDQVGTATKGTVYHQE